ncbi:hypothetical protein ACIGXM_01640 [Kitasatospora sp. NPDC052896]|uniref:hypothetical protein n=1 Tax=Kitasatospora sp. NPDC052896 TaxID=3364061 RepID=UPI0037CBD7DF
MSKEVSLSPEIQQRIDEVQALMTEEVFEEMLSREGIDPADLTVLLDVVAIGLTNGSWRNSCVENWHAEGRLSDGDMMRINSHTTHGVRQRLRQWAKDFGITTGTHEELAQLTVEDTDDLAYRLFHWLTNPRRKLPTGMTLGALARTREDLKEYEGNAERSLGGFAWQAETRGLRHALLHAAAHGALACQGWWAHPSWPARVDQFVAVLDDSADPYWGPAGEYRERLLPEPAGLRDRRALRATLLKVPWELDTVTAEWITDSGIGYLRPAQAPSQRS